MWNYAVWSLSFVAAVTGVTLPQAIVEDSHYVVPIQNSDNEYTVEVLPKVQHKPQPTKTTHDHGPALTSKAALVMDATTGAVLWEKNATAELPIASITKLMTALVAHDHVTDWNALHTMDYTENGVIGVKFPASNGDQFVKYDLLKTAMVSSANNAALAVAHSTGLPQAEFVEAMNAKADQLGMVNSHFVEPTGLEEGNTATVKDVAIMMRTVQQFPWLFEPTGQTQHQFTPKRTEEEGNAEGSDSESSIVDAGGPIAANTTNQLLEEDHPYVIGGKTGFTYEAGYCLTTVAENEAGQRIIVVTLGGEFEDTRFTENDQLINWTFQNYQWK